MGLGVGRDGTFHILRFSQSLLAASFPNPPAPSWTQVPALLTPSASCREEGNEDVGNGGTLCLRPSCPGELLTQPALKSQPESGDQEAPVQAAEQLYPHHPPTLPHPAPHMRLQLLARSLCILPGLAILPAEQIAAVPGVSQYGEAAYGRGHCGHMENIPDAALRGPGRALHIGHGPHLLGQHSALEGWSKSRDQVRGQGKG